jgi:hypoxanthine phosphoribosyltransferase
MIAQIRSATNGTEKLLLARNLDVSRNHYHLPKMGNWPHGVGSILLEEQQIQNRVAELGSLITEDFKQKAPLMVGVLRGAVIFHADLVREVALNVKIDFMSVSSYGSATIQSGEVRLVKDLETSIQGQDVILVEDIVDTGLTLSYLVRNLQSREPASLTVCSLLSKPSSLKTPVTVDYLGFEIADHYVVGYGLDFDQKYRNLPYIAALEQ